MNELDNLPDDFWRKAFDGAEERPPQRVWDAVERQLDDDSKARVLPLWGAGLTAGLRTLTWGAGAAASVALLLTGWWYMHTTGTPKAGRSVVATAHVDPAAQSAPATAQLDHQSTQRATLAMVAHKPVLATRFHRNQMSPETHGRSTFTLFDNSSLVASMARRYARSATEPLSHAVHTIASTQWPGQPEPVDMTQSITLSIVAVSPDAEQAGPLPVQHNQSAVQLVASSPQQTRANSNAGQVSIEPAGENLAASDGKTTRIRHEKWASLSVMPGAFNPVVSVVNSPVAIASNAVYANSAYRNQNTAAGTVDSRGSRSVAYQLSAGMQLTDRWSVETGVGYLAAQSTVESPTQVSLSNVAMLTTNDVQATNNLYVDALRSRISSQANAYVTADNGLTQAYTAGRYGSSERQTVSNDYQFVQVPVQVGYQLRPRKRLGLALIGGFLTNIFVRNTVASQVVVTPTDNIYRSLSWAASLGARFRYRPTQHWSASLAGLYQPTLGTNTVSDAPIQTHPISAGMSFGVDYHF